MERFCRQCHAILAADRLPGFCPACGGVILDRPSIPNPDGPEPIAASVDHRGIVLPSRHALGGIITPQ